MASTSVVLLLFLLPLPLLIILLRGRRRALPSSLSRRPRRVFVTGAASGIGRRLVSRLVASNHVVVASDWNQALLQRAAEEEGWAVLSAGSSLDLPPVLIESSEDLLQKAGSVLLRQVDVRQADHWSSTMDEAFHTLGGLDVLINVAGVLSAKYFAQMNLSEIDQVIDVNIKGVIYGCQTAVRMWQSQAGNLPPLGGAHIVNISSMSSLCPIAGLSVYSASKFAVRAFTLAIAKELEPFNINLSCISPDAVDTDMLRHQADKPCARMTFSSPNILKTDDVVDAILTQAMQKRQLDIWLPTSRGYLALFGNTFYNSLLVRKINDALTDAAAKAQSIYASQSKSR